MDTLYLSLPKISEMNQDPGDLNLVYFSKCNWFKSQLPSNNLSKLCGAFQYPMFLAQTTARICQTADSRVSPRVDRLPLLSSVWCWSLGSSCFPFHTQFFSQFVTYCVWSQPRPVLWLFLPSWILLLQYLCIMIFFLWAYLTWHFSVTHL